MISIHRIEREGFAEEFPGENIGEMRLVHSKLPNKTLKKVYVVYNKAVKSWKTEFGTSHELSYFHDLVLREKGHVSNAFTIQNLFLGKRNQRGYWIELSYFDRPFRRLLVKTVSRFKFIAFVLV